jgi:hypothetical protein
MWQAVVTYLIVAGAAAWVAWHVVLPTGWRAAVRARLSRADAAPGDCDDCDCGSPR